MYSCSNTPSIDRIRKTARLSNFATCTHGTRAPEDPTSPPSCGTGNRAIEPQYKRPSENSSSIAWCRVIRDIQENQTLCERPIMAAAGRLGQLGFKMEEQIGATSTWRGLGLFEIPGDGYFGLHRARLEPHEALCVSRTNDGYHP